MEDNIFFLIALELCVVTKNLKIHKAKQSPSTFRQNLVHIEEVLGHIVHHKPSQIKVCYSNQFQQA
jgi:hypothetical protein